MTKKVTKYDAGRHPNRNQGRVKLLFADGSKSILNIKDPAEFNVILQLLSMDDSPFVTSNGWLATGPEEPGD